VRTLRRVSDRFNDPIAFMATTESWERWTWLSLEGPGLAHPMHVHAFTFQARARVHYDVSTWQTLRRPDGGLGGGTTAPVRPREPGVIVPGEGGWKDVIRVGSGELVTVIGRYGPAAGRFLHHCHVYEHEDHRMMRAFSLLPGTIARLDPHNH
jgi:FtsP/CotA-like multicopper oxidase with cupredoxin domain